MKSVICLIILLLAVTGYSQETFKEKMPLTYANIAKKAAEHWPGDYEMQKFTIEKQCDAYTDYTKLLSDPPAPDKVMAEICSAALKSWCDNDWIDCIDKFLNTSKDATSACFGADWEMVVYTINKQIDAYNSLK